MLRRLAIAAALLTVALQGVSVNRAAAITIPTPSVTRPLVILTEGDSITEGSNAQPAADGYRTELDRLLTLAGVPHTFVVDAHSGWSCANLESTAPAAVAQYNPDYAMLDCGTNDMPSPDQGNTFQATYTELLNKMWAASPNGQLKILPSWITYSADLNRSPNTALQATEPVANDAIYRAWINDPHRYAGTLTTPADFQSLPEGYLDSTVPPSYGSGIHPSVVGYAAMARIWYRMLRDSYYSGAGWPDPPSTCGLTGHRPGGYTPTYIPC